MVYITMNPNFMGLWIMKKKFFLIIKYAYP